jgi:hypothetical protein
MKPFAVRLSFDISGTATFQEDGRVRLSLGLECQTIVRHGIQWWAMIWSPPHAHSHPGSILWIFRSGLIRTVIRQYAGGGTVACS